MSQDEVAKEINEYITKKEMGYDVAPIDLETLRRWSHQLALDWDYDTHQPSYDAGYESGREYESTDGPTAEKVDELEEQIEELKKEIADFKEETEYNLDEAIESAIAIKDNVIRLRDRMKEL